MQSAEVNFITSAHKKNPILRIHNYVQLWCFFSVHTPEADVTGISKIDKFRK